MRQSFLALFATVSLMLPLVAVPGSAKGGHWHECLGKRVTIRGSAQGEVIVGTPGSDVIVAQGGDDFVYGNGGKDRICGGSGMDQIVGGGGFDRAHGGGGQDHCDAERRRKCESVE